jgi:hypothetical protein
MAGLEAASCAHFAAEYLGSDQAVSLIHGPDAPSGGPDLDKDMR